MGGGGGKLTWVGWGQAAPGGGQDTPEYLQRWRDGLA